MNSAEYKLKGLSPLIMHNNQAANPFNDYCKAMKPITKKRNKTDDDFMEIARLEWEAGLYLHDGVVAMPAANLERCFWDGAKKRKMGKQFKSGAMVQDDFHTLAYQGKRISVKQNGDIPNPNLDEFFQTHKHQTIVRVSNQQVLRTRPIFYEWSMVLTVVFDPQVLDLRSVTETLQDAGRLVGLGDWRPRFGRFEVESL